MTFDESTTAITRIACAQSDLLDYTGHVVAGMRVTTRRALVAEIQALRSSVGWSPLDMAGRIHPHNAWDALCVRRINGERTDDTARCRVCR